MPHTYILGMTSTCVVKEKFSALRKYDVNRNAFSVVVIEYEIKYIVHTTRL